MEDLTNYTPTELLKMGNDTATEHMRIKNEILGYSYEIENLEKKINEKLGILDRLEKEYVNIVNEIDKR